jgi:hypothetical protein
MKKEEPIRGLHFNYPGLRFVYRSLHFELFGNSTGS